MAQNWGFCLWYQSIQIDYIAPIFFEANGRKAQKSCVL